MVPPKNSVGLGQYVWCSAVALAHHDAAEVPFECDVAPAQVGTLGLADSARVNGQSAPTPGTEFSALRRKFDTEVPADPAVHPVMDNASTHTHPLESEPLGSHRN
ncbi:hypothetical protein C5613_31185 [Rhodococcus opacus]|uniref:Uncharacterized protein n=1 Tax=Rhodococcus opacus TaxID=37919 RepID=A0A2S8IW84_RHOOP|nr:hypothetical protein C5613_31185 [Rhodococcus opacus]